MVSCVDWWIQGFDSCYLPTFSGEPYDLIFVWCQYTWRKNEGKKKFIYAALTRSNGPWLLSWVWIPKSPRKVVYCKSTRKKNKNGAKINNLRNAAKTLGLTMDSLGIKIMLKMNSCWTRELVIVKRSMLVHHVKVVTKSESCLWQADSVLIKKTSKSWNTPRKKVAAKKTDTIVTGKTFCRKIVEAKFESKFENNRHIRRMDDSSNNIRWCVWLCM